MRKTNIEESCGKQEGKRCTKEQNVGPICQANFGSLLRQDCFGQTTEQAGIVEYMNLCILQSWVPPPPPGLEIG